MIEDWSRYPDFRESEFRCSHTGKCDMHPDLLDILQEMRKLYGKPIFISSGYRDPSHPIEAMKDEPGEHTKGMAADIICYTQGAVKLLYLALYLGVNRIGLHQKGRASDRYMHIGLGDKLTNDYQKSIWTY